MNRNKKLYILLGVLAFFCIATFALTKVEEKKEEIKNSDEIILEIDRVAVTELSWECESNTFSFLKEDTWEYEEDENFPVDETAIDSLLSIFEAWSASFVIENVEDYSQYGLEEPTCTITMKVDGKSYEVKVGEYSTMDSKRYVSIGDGNVYLVSTDLYEYYNVELDDMLKHDELPTLSEVSKIVFTGEEEYEISYIEESEDTYCAEDVYFIKQDEKTVPLDTNNVEGYLGSVTSLGLTNYATYNVTEEELESYGFNTPEMTVAISYLDDEEEKNFVLFISSVETTSDDGEKSTQAYVRVGESQLIYSITLDEYEGLMAASYNDLRHKQVFTGSFDDVEKIDFTLEKQRYSITSAETDETRSYSYDGEVIDITSLQTAVTALEAYSFTTEEATEKEEIRFTVYLNHETFSKVEIVLYRYDGDYCLATVDGTPFALVARSAVVDLIEAVNGIVL